MRREGMRVDGRPKASEMKVERQTESCKLQTANLKLKVGAKTMEQILFRPLLGLVYLGA
jgi:hypothetical protein